ncbi:hypothetical protein [Tateyamaria sp. SN6-1]|uniref:hypothetical protein n=1 Tax=Tateyamaria sp. SN6-1 TaxID=3092148 RepID=UPI0039F4F701
MSRFTRCAAAKTILRNVLKNPFAWVGLTQSVDALPEVIHRLYPPDEKGFAALRKM